jgi:cyclin-dependent kinase 12/13
MEQNKGKGSIYMVFEYMDHDLTGLTDRNDVKFGLPQIKVSTHPFLVRLPAVGSETGDVMA